jgi:hypothetical protein
MARRILPIVLFILLSSVAGFGQSSYKGLTPGKSTRAEVERVLGLPVKKISETLIEYRPQPLTKRVYVQYREGAPIVERIEVLYQLQNSTCEDFIKSLNLRLPEGVSSSRTEGDKTNTYYGQPFFIVTYEDGKDTTRLAFYSRELFESAQESNAEKLAQEQSRPPALTGAYGEVTGIVKLRAADGSLKPVAGATVDFYRTDMPGQLQTKTNNYGQFIQVGLSQTGTWVVVVSGSGIEWTYMNGINPPGGNVEIIAEPGDGSRPTREQVMSSIR